MSPAIRTFALALSLLPASLGAFAQTLNASGDAHVRGGSAADNNYGGTVLLGVRTASNALNTYWSYLKFDTSGVSGQVISAKVRLLTALSSNGSVQTNLYGVPATWGESTITWNNKPALGAQLGSFTVANTGYVWFELDVTAYVQAQQGQGAVAFALANPAQSSQLTAIQSRESANPPQLVLVTNSAPTVSLTAPASGAVFAAPANITVSASAADADGSVTQVQFFANGSPIGTDTSAPYSIDWTSVPSGSYSLTAVATDNNGATTTSAAVPIVVNALPTVSLSSPAAGATFTAPASITLTAEAADTDGTITGVEFYHGTTLITALTAAPYTFNWTNVPQGAYVLTAKAIDDRGAATTSAPVNVTVGAAVGQLYFIHADHLNTPRLVANAAGQTVWLWHQAEPFGNNVPDENPSGLGVFDLPLRLPGQRYDAETGLHYNYFRDYDPSIGRYGESDPLGLKAGLNTYAYGIGNPLSNIDPQGLDVYICTRPVDVSWIPNWASGYLPPHTWIKTDTYESGMGGNCPVPGQQCSDKPYSDTTTKSHAGQSTQPNSTCVRLQNVSEQCVNNLIKPGSPTGTWSLYNQCQSFAWSVTGKCRYGPQIGPALPDTLQQRGPLGSSYGP